MKTIYRSRGVFFILLSIPFVLFIFVGNALAGEEKGIVQVSGLGHASAVLTETVTVPVEITSTIKLTVTVVPTGTEIVPPVDVVTPTAVVTPTLVPTETPIPTETAAPSPTVTLEPVDYGRDVYEPDSREFPTLWTGTERQEFAPAGDVDYVLYFVKVGRTVIQTKDLSGAADTVLEVWHGGEMLAVDDDSGVGLASVINLDSDLEKEILIIIRNKSVGYGSGVGYTLEIIPEAAFTPTPTQAATSTPVVQPATATPMVVTATPTATPIPPPPTVAAPVVQQPRQTATPSFEFVLRADVFIDADRDGELDAGEGIDGIFIEARTLDTKVSFTGYTAGGIAIIEVVCPPGSHSPFSQLEVMAPYLQRSKFLDINHESDTLITNFALEAAVLPIALP